MSKQVVCVRQAHLELILLKGQRHIETSERVENETSDIESLILDSSSSSEITKANDEEVETGSLEEFIEDQF